MESYKIKGKEYLVEEVSRIEIQDSNPGVYGWTLEYKSRYSDTWHMCWGNRIYNSRQSALNASIQIGINSKEEFRISPLYKMDNAYMREFKISQVLDGKTPEDKKLSEIKAWKLKEDIDESGMLSGYATSLIGKHKRGSIFIQLENGSIIKSGNVSDKTRFLWSSSFKKLLSSELFDEIELKEEKWLYPHLLKELKNKIK
jgi:hypothetical protein